MAEDRVRGERGALRRDRAATRRRDRAEAKMVKPATSGRGWRRGAA